MFKTEQEAFWAGDFGAAYVRRNSGGGCAAAEIALLSRALQNAQDVGDCIEFGANVGLNLRALQVLRPGQIQYAVEINRKAATELAAVIPAENIFCASILDFEPDRPFDLVLVKGLLIHIHPRYLQKVYETLHRAVGRYLLICEYYNPTPVAVDYRGFKDRLFKRDFCGEMLDTYRDLQLVDYGFVYHRDPCFPQDDVTWFLMQKVHR